MQRKVWMVLLAWLFAATQVAAEARIALIIGNSVYTSVNGLPNSTADARLMADSLTAIGFDVTLVSEGTFSEMRTAISQFGAKLRGAGRDATGLFYYAGHGVQSFGRNYFLPVDTELSNAADISLVAIEADSVLQQMRSAGNKTNIVILDACRNNPFKKVLDLGENGLAEMNAPTGTFLAFATSPGAAAYDGGGDHSPFTEALAAEIQQPGVSLEQVFKEVRRSVMAKTDNKQTPWDTSSLTADFYFVPVKQLSLEEQAEQQFWEATKSSNDVVQIAIFMKTYPKSVHIEEALKLLTTASTPSPAAGPDTGEQAVFDQAQKLATRDAYKAFIAKYPDSVLLEMATTEMNALPDDAAVAAVAPDASTPADTSTPDTVVVASNGEEKGLSSIGQDPEDPASYADLKIAFDTPLVVGSPEIVGRTLDQLLTDGSPIFAPIEGLPEEVWRGKKCTTCHQWKRENLCDQAKVLLGQGGESAERSLGIKHPLGLPFKLTLGAWAKDGCQ